MIKSLIFFAILYHFNFSFAQPALSLSNVGTGEYKFAATIDKDVLDDRETELWAQVYYPLNFTQASPIAVLLHGNHGTCGRGENPRIDDSCQYTETGKCPKDYVVVPNHMGYTYLAEKLAQKGIVVVSINANRGITCGSGNGDDWGLNLARGRLVLKHLEKLSVWNKKGGAPKTVGVDLKGKIDFSKVALMGHSRGGEGMRAAYNIYSDVGSPWPQKIQSPLNVRAIFEIGPVDGQTDRVLNAFDTSWTVLLPMCDGDVSSLEGIAPLDRMMVANKESRPSSKAAVTVWGTNHNFYNTEWQESDSYGCKNHDPLWEKKDGTLLQQKTGELTLVPFFAAKLLGDTAEYLTTFDSIYEVPAELTKITRVDRTYVQTVDDQWLKKFEMDSKTIDKTSKVKKNYEAIKSHPSDLRGVSLAWTAAGENVYYQMLLSGSGLDLTNYDVFSVRLNREEGDQQQDIKDFSISLIDTNGKISAPLSIAEYVDMSVPADHALLQTVRIAMKDFGNSYDPAKVQFIKMTFNKAKSGKIYLAQPAFQKSGFAENLDVLPVLNQGKKMGNMVRLPADETATELPIQARFISSDSQKGKTGDLIELEAENKFVVRNALPVLKIGNREYYRSRFAANGSTDKIFFDIGYNSDFKHKDLDEVRFYYKGSAEHVTYRGGLFRDLPRR